jgi:hypothetical protein
MKGIDITKLPEEVTIEGDHESLEVRVNGIVITPSASLKHRNHSPDGFNWGYGGSGPAQLALAILLLYLEPEDALRIYQDFKFGFIAGLPQSDFKVTINLRDTISNSVKSRHHEL